MVHIQQQILRVALIFMVTVLIACTQQPKSNNRHVDDNSLGENQLKSELNRVSEARNEEQIAIMQYILFVDSLEKKLNSLQENYTLLYNNDELRTNDRKLVLLQRMELIQAKIEKDKKRISELEKKIIRLQKNDTSKALLKLVAKLKEERIELESKIKNLHVQVSNLQQQVVEKEEAIEQQNSVIEHQTAAIRAKDLTIATQQSNLNAKYALLVGKDKIIQLEVFNSQVIIPQKKSRVKILNDYGNNCRLLKKGRGESIITINKQLWVNTRFLIIEVKGDF